MKKYITVIGIFIVLATCTSVSHKDTDGKRSSASYKMPRIELDTGGISTKPKIKVNIEMHTAPINEISLDRSEKYLVSGSDDKTIKVWDFSEIVNQNKHTLKLIRTIRLPIGDDDNGEIKTVSINPDGDLIIASGIFKESGKKNNCIFIIQRSTGRVLQRIENLEFKVNFIKFSPSGNYFVASFHNRGGIQIYSKDNSEWKLKAWDKNYGDTANKFAFSQDGKLLATTSFDGKVRLYNLKAFEQSGVLKPLLEVIGKSSAPYSIAFSPGGKALAVAYQGDNIIAAELYTIKNYKLEHLEIINSPRGSSEAYIEDITYSKNNNLYISSQSDFGTGTYNLIGGNYAITSLNTVTSILPFSKGIVYASKDPIIGGINNTTDSYDPNKYLFLNVSSILLSNFQSFFNSDDGKIIGFTSGWQDNYITGEFDIEKLDYSNEARSFPEVDPNLRPTRFNVSIEYDKILFNKQALDLDKNELPSHLKIQAREMGFLIGTNQNLRYYDDKGSLIWKTKTPSKVLSIGLSKDAKLSFSSFSDGTIRWYNLNNGQELLAFIPIIDFKEKDSLFENKSENSDFIWSLFERTNIQYKRWIVWTPQGYYTVSIGGEELIGWHVNRGNNVEADFFPISKFRDSYYRPDVIAKVLEYGDVDKALAAANQELEKVKGDTNIIVEADSIKEISPPKLEFNTDLRENIIATSEPTVEIDLLIESGHDTKVKEILVKVDEATYFTKPVELNIDSDKPYNYVVKMDSIQRDCMLSVFVKDKNAYSEPLKIKYIWSGPKGNKRPSIYATFIGVGDEYKDDSIPKIQYVGNDINKMKNFYSQLVQKKSNFYHKVYLGSVIKNREGTKEKILKALENIVSQEKEVDDLTIIYLSGHGVSIGNGSYFYITRETIASSKKSIVSTALSAEEIIDKISKNKGRTILFLDSCYSGGLFNPDSKKLVNTLISPEHSIVVFSSSKGSEKSLSIASQISAFTNAIVEGLKGKADPYNDRKVTVKTLDTWLSREVTKTTSKKQNPVTYYPPNTEDFDVLILEK